MKIPSARTNRRRGRASPGGDLVLGVGFAPNLVHQPNSMFPGPAGGARLSLNLSDVEGKGPTKGENCAAKEIDHIALGKVALPGYIS